MIKNFHIVQPNLYRGGAPPLRDVVKLYENCGVNRIISLDNNVGQFIKPICQKYNIDHIILPVEANNINSLKYLLKQNLRNLVEDDVPTFVHCKHGKDRTGFFIALVRCLLNNWDCKQAIIEAKQLGFGTGLDLSTEKFYTKLISRACSHNHTDSNAAFDIHDNIGDLNAQYRDYQLDPMQHSWAPYADESVRSYPPGTIQRYYEGTGTTRQNYDLKDINSDTINIDNDNHIPSVGVYDAVTQITNFTGPSLVGGGFV